MDVIGIQAKARPLVGSIEHYWFENPHVGLSRTRFHRIVIPFEPFDSGLEYVTQPERTKLVVDWIELDLDDPSRLDSVTISADRPKGVEASIYLGHRHNWTDLHRLTLRGEGTRFTVECEATIDFEFEGVAQNERFEFKAYAIYLGEAQDSEPA